MNEVALHRGASPHLNTIDVFVDGQHLTESVVCIFRVRIPRFHVHVQIPVRRPHCVYSDRLDCIFALCWRTDRAPVPERDRVDANLPAKPIVPTSRLPVLFVHHTSGTFSGIFPHGYCRRPLPPLAE